MANPNPTKNLRGGSESLPEEKRKKSVTVWLAPGDDAAVETICKHLGVLKGDAVRTAIRVYAAILLSEKR